MTILITGAAGYIGSHIAWHLHDHGHSLVFFDDLSSGNRALPPPTHPFVVGDIADEALLRETLTQHKVQTIIHLAAKVSVAESMVEPGKYYDHNVARTGIVLKAAQEAGVKRLLFSSTATVYANPQPMPLDESANIDPISSYARSKRMVEWMLESAHQAHGLTYAVLRFFNAAGADPKGRTGQSTADATHLIKIACEAACGKRDGMAMFGTDYPTPDGTCIRDYVHVGDLAEINRLALGYLEAGGAPVTLNCGYGRGASVREVVRMVQSISGKVFPVREAPRRPGDPAMLIASNEKLKATLGWKPLYDDLETIIRHALDWEKRLSR